MDIRNIINPHRNCGADAQLEAINADSKKMKWPDGETYTQTKNGNEIDAAILSCRKRLKSIVRAMWLFNLAPIEVKAHQKRKIIEQRIKSIHAAGFIFREAATGRQSNCPADLVAMTHQSARMIADFGKGAAGQLREGRPKKVRTDADRSVMQPIWESRRYKKVDDALQAMREAGILRLTRGECYRLFGARG